MATGPGVAIAAQGGAFHGWRDGVAVALHGRLDAWVGPGSDPGVVADPCGAVAIAYRRHGTSFAAHLRGDFAILLLDEKDGTVVGARDWIGARPLFWGRAGVRVAIASEVKQVLALLDRPLVVHQEVLDNWREDGQMPLCATFARAVEAVPPSGQLILRGGRARLTHRRVRFPPLEADQAVAGALIRAALERAVVRRSAGSAALGVLISGGLDSTSIAATAAQIAALRAGPPVVAGITFVVRSVPASDETLYARSVAERWGIPWYPIEVDAAEAVDWARTDAFDVHDGPTHPTFFLVARAIRAARERGVDTLLVGQGADHWQGHYDYGMELAGLRGDWRTAVEWGRHTARQRPVSTLWRAGKLVVKRGLRRRAEHAFELGAVDYWMRSALESEEREGSRAGLRVEFPFADHDLAATLSGLPTRIRIRPGTAKLAIRTAMDGLLPPVVTSRADAPDFDAIWREASDVPNGRTAMQHAETVYADIWRDTFDA